MALSIFHHPSSSDQNLTVLAGYESGHTSVSILLPSSTTNTTKQASWRTTYISNPHDQPILSLAPSIECSFFLTSAADAVIAKHPIPHLSSDGEEDDVEVVGSVGGTPIKILKTKHAGQQSLQMRNDGLVFATAGWDARVRVYSARGMKELAVLKWHKEGCYAVAFADVVVHSEELGENVGNGDIGDEKGKGKEVVKRIGSVSVKEERLRKAKMAHWLAVGSKDGKVSLWDIY